MTVQRPNRDPRLEPLRAVRGALLRLHKALIDSERIAVESRSGALSNTQFLQALMEDEAFAWLRPYSRLIVEVDEALADREVPVTDERARAFVERIGGLATPGAAPTDPLRAALDRDPAVRFAHAELARATVAALDPAR